MAVPEWIMAIFKKDPRAVREKAMKKLRKEAPVPLDRARYIAVASGQIAPYLRVLAEAELWVAPEFTDFDEADSLRFVRAFCTPLRARAVFGPGEFVRVGVRDFPAGVGLRTDPSLGTELTVEPDQLEDVRALAAGQFVPAALKAVAADEVVEEPELGGQVGADLAERVRVAAGEGALVQVTGLRLAGEGGRAWPAIVVTGPVEEDFAAISREGWREGVAVIVGGA